MALEVGPEHEELRERDKMMLEAGTETKKPMKRRMKL